jgi:hypothetical protein
VNWDQIRPEYRPFVRRWINPDPKPPDLDGFAVYCTSCPADRPVHMSMETDAGTYELYYKYMCDECHTVLLTITPVTSHS